MARVGQGVVHRYRSQADVALSVAHDKRDLAKWPEPETVALGLTVQERQALVLEDIARGARPPTDGARAPLSPCASHKSVDKRLSRRRSNNASPSKARWLLRARPNLIRLVLTVRSSGSWGPDAS